MEIYRYLICKAKLFPFNCLQVDGRSYSLAGVALPIDMEIAVREGVTAGGIHPVKQESVRKIRRFPPSPTLDHDSQSLARLPVALQATLREVQYSEVSLRKLLGRDPRPDQSLPNEPIVRCQSPP